MHNIHLQTIQSGDVVADGSRAHMQAYGCLRHLVRMHINSRNLPLLAESLTPTGGYESVRAQGGALLEAIHENAAFVRE